MVEKILKENMFINEKNIEIEETLYTVFPEIKYSNKKEIISFTEFEAEYEALKHGVGLTLHKAGVIRIGGNDAADYLQRVSSNDITSLKDEHFKATLFLNDKGKIIDRTNLLHFDSDLLMVAGGHNKNKLLHWIRKFIISEDVQLEDVSEQYFLINVYGQQADSFISLYYGDRSEEFESNKYILDSIEGIDSILFKDYLNNYYFFSILVNSKNLLAFCKFVRESHSVFDVRFAGKDAFEIFRVEQGFPFYPNEICDFYNPYDLNLLTDVSFNKGCYIGQEIVARLDTYPNAKRKFRGVCFEGTLPEVPAKIFNKSGEEAGVLTSVVESKLLQQPIGVGPIKESAPDEEILFLEDGRELKLERLPFGI